MLPGLTISSYLNVNSRALCNPWSCNILFLGPLSPCLCLFYQILGRPFGGIRGALAHGLCPSNVRKSDLVRFEIAVMQNLIFFPFRAPPDFHWVLHSCDGSSSCFHICRSDVRFKFPERKSYTEIPAWYCVAITSGFSSRGLGINYQLACIDLHSRVPTVYSRSIHVCTQ